MPGDDALCKWYMCRNYYAGVWVRHADWKEAEFFDELPAHLRGEVAGYLMEEVFEQSDFFRWGFSCRSDCLSMMGQNETCLPCASHEVCSWSAVC